MSDQMATMQAAMQSAMQRKLDADKAASAARRAPIAQMREQLNAGPAPGKLQAEALPSSATPLPSSLPEFSKARDLAGQRANAAGQEAVGSVARRFAALGGLNSGAAIKAQSMAQDQAAQNKEAAMGQIDMQEAAALRGENDKLAARDEAAKARNLSRETANMDREFQDKVFRFDQGSKLAQLDMAADQFDLDKETTEFNKQQAKWQQEHSGGLFGAGGFLGTGIG